MKKKYITTLSIFFLTVFFIVTMSGQEISTVEEIYDFEIGDEFHRAGNYYMIYEGHTLWQQIDEIIDKFYSTTGDTLFYSIYRQYSEYTDENPSWQYYDTTILEYYINLELPINDGDIDSVYSDSLWFNGRLINSYEYSIYWEYQLIWFVEGCGQGYHFFYYHDGMVHFEGESWIVYFNKNGEEYGEPIVITNNSEFDFTKPEIIVYPNPSLDKIFIKHRINNSKNQKIEIFNIQGQLVERITKFNKMNNCVDITKLQSGIYFLRLTLDSKILESKFIKR
jgi:hypothetical protein